MSIFTSTHKASTVMREAFLVCEMKQARPIYDDVASAILRGVGSFNRRDVTLTNPSRDTIKELKRLEVIPA
jgi:hypothetical protein